MSIYDLHTLYLWLAALITLGIYSFLYSDNRVYRALLNGMVGLSTGYNFIVMWKQVLGPKWWDPMSKGFSALWHGSPGAWGAMWIIVGFLGLLWYFQFSRKHFWLSRIVIGMMMGMGAGVVFKAQFLLNMPQITDSLRPLVASAPNMQKYPDYPNGIPLTEGAGPIDLFTSFNNILYIATIVAVMVYFFFSFSHDSKIVSSTAKFGRWMLMVSFGAFFGNTVMTRMGVFLQRAQFLAEEWGPRKLWYGLPSIAYAAILAAAFAAIYIAIRRPPSKPPLREMVGEEEARAKPDVRAH